MLGPAGDKNANKRPHSPILKHDESMWDQGNVFMWLQVCHRNPIPLLHHHHHHLDHHSTSTAGGTTPTQEHLCHSSDTFTCASFYDPSEDDSWSDVRHLMGAMAVVVGVLVGTIMVCMTLFADEDDSSHA